MKLGRAAWQRAIVLMVLSRAGLPVTLPQIGAALGGAELNAVWAELCTLMEFGAVSRDGGPRAYRYFATQIVRLAAG